MNDIAQNVPHPQPPPESHEFAINLDFDPNLMSFMEGIRKSIVTACGVPPMSHLVDHTENTATGMRVLMSSQHDWSLVAGRVSTVRAAYWLKKQFGIIIHQALENSMREEAARRAQIKKFNKRKKQRRAVCGRRRK